MKAYSGNLTKMVTTSTSPVSYSLPIGEHLLPLNPLIGKKLTLEFHGRINCIACNRETKNSFQQGYCFPCTRKLAQCDLCIVKPSLCHSHKGTCREPKWGDMHCMIPHIVYLSNASGLKVGITRKSQVPTRWIDQGAIAAMPVFEVANRRISGLIEAEMSKTMSDRTNWRNMLKNKIDPIDLAQEKQNVVKAFIPIIEKIKAEFGPDAIELINHSQLFEFDYPVMAYPSSIKSLSFDKQNKIEGILEGIKGQYLIFDCGVINIRKFSGYWVECY